MRRGGPTADATRGRRWARLVAFVAAGGLGAITLVAGCGGSGHSTLDRLRDDPAVSVTPAGVASERVSESEGNAGVKPAPAQYRRTFVLSADSDVDAAITSLAEEARAAGWTLVPREQIGFNGTKQIESVSAQLVISAVAAERTVWIELSARL